MDGGILLFHSRDHHERARLLIGHNTQLTGLFQVWRDCESIAWGARSKASRSAIFWWQIRREPRASLKATRGLRETRSALYREAHFLEKVGVSRVVVEILE